MQQVFLNYFNKVYNLYGRKVVLQPFTATGNSTSEALNQGQAQACADAATVAQMPAFGEAGLPFDYQFPGTGPFSQCAANDKVVEFDGDVYKRQTPAIMRAANVSRIEELTAAARTASPAKMSTRSTRLRRRHQALPTRLRRRSSASGSRGSDMERTVCPGYDTGRDLGVGPG